MEENIKNFKCLGKDCPNHCCGAFDGISNKLKELSNVKFSEIILLPEDVESIKKAGKEKYIVSEVNGVHKIKTQEDGTCLALEDGKCAIYEQRPSICKAFPLYIDMFAGLCYVNECSAFNPTSNTEEYKNALKSLLEIYKYWISYYEGMVD